MYENGLPLIYKEYSSQKIFKRQMNNDIEDGAGLGGSGGGGLGDGVERE